MALIVDYENHLGTMYFLNTETPDQRPIKVEMYGGNALAAHILKKGKEEELFGFWSDLQHLKNCLGMNKKMGNTNIYTKYGNCLLFKVCLDVSKKDMDKVGVLFAKAGFDVCFYNTKNNLSERAINELDKTGTNCA